MSLFPKVPYSLVVFISLWLWPVLFNKYASVNYSYIERKDIEDSLVGNLPVDKSRICVSNVTSSSVDGVDLSMTDGDFARTFSIKNGFWEPLFCTPRYKVSLVVPYRDRSEQLQYFVKYMHRFLIEQLVEHRIYIIEQTNKKLFNRGKLLNIGFTEAKKLDPHVDCTIYHDVDLFPTNLHNIYACLKLPRHMSSAVNTFRFALPYSTIFGGATAILNDQMELLNGYPNTFEGWGGEDDAMYNRITNNGLQILRFDPIISTYNMMSHVQAVPSSTRYKSLSNALSEDGLTNLFYDADVEFFPLYVHVKAVF